jgi:hypothetical protein
MENEGIRFSLIYLERSTPFKDSKRFRNRLAAFFRKELDKYSFEIFNIIKTETGAEIPRSPVALGIPDFFKENELRDVLDAITLIYSGIPNDYSHNDKKWKDFVERVFKEENLGYKLDSKCGVHYFVDEEFERNRFSALSILMKPQYAGIRAAYEDAYRYMDSVPADSKAAVRAMFEAIEILVKQMTQAKNLSKKVVENSLKDKCLPLYSDNNISQKVLSQMFDGFAQWVDALHNYRHGQPNEEPVAPTEDMCIYILSSGSAFLRWLIGMDNRLNLQS